jgi:hypothetical protein
MAYATRTGTKDVSVLPSSHVCALCKCEAQTRAWRRHRAGPRPGPETLRLSTDRVAAGGLT